ncbi:MAG: DUF1569 domain-containing protein [Phycisphaerales bacterium JB041]
MTQVNTKAVNNRRDLRLGTLDDLIYEIDRIERAGAAQSLRPLGNWSPGQNLEHLAKFMACSLDGFPDEPPLLFKAFGRVLRKILGKKLLTRTPPPGLKLPKKVSFLPAEEVSVAAGASALRAQIERVRGGAAFIPASPFFGRLSREQWIELHLRHAELHLSFVGIEGEAA